MMPAFTSSSLNLPISARSFSLGITPASDFAVALTITMTRIAVLLPYREDALGRDDRRRLTSEVASTELVPDRHARSLFFAAGGRRTKSSWVPAVIRRVGVRP